MDFLECLSHDTDYRVTTRNRTVTGTYFNRESTGVEQGGYNYFYFRNEPDMYRVTLISNDTVTYADVNKTDGSHETLAMMEPVESVEPFK